MKSSIIQCVAFVTIFVLSLSVSVQLFFTKPTVLACAVCIQGTIQVIMAEQRKSILEIDREYQLKEELDKRYCHENGMIYQKSLQCVNRDRDDWYTEITEHLGCQRSDLSSDVFNTRKANKETLCEWLSNADDLVEQ